MFNGLEDLESDSEPVTRQAKNSINDASINSAVSMQRVMQQGKKKVKIGVANDTTNSESYQKAKKIEKPLKRGKTSLHGTLAHCLVKAKMQKYE